MDEILAELVRLIERSESLVRPERIDGENAVGFETNDGELFFIELQQP